MEEGLRLNQADSSYPELHSGLKCQGNLGGGAISTLLGHRLQVALYQAGCKISGAIGPKVYARRMPFQGASG